MSRFYDLLIALGIPLLLVTGLTAWLSERRHHLPPPLALLVRHSGRIWLSGIVLLTSLIVMRYALSRN